MRLVDNMTRSDIELAIIQLDEATKEETEKFIHILHTKIENTYEILFALERQADRLQKDDEVLHHLVKRIAQELRKTLES